MENFIIDGNKINRGAARIVYARQDLNGNGIYIVFRRADFA